VNSSRNINDYYLQITHLKIQDTFTVAADFFFKRHFVSPHIVIKYIIWSTAAPAAKQLFCS
jgi:hypothetical protein